MILALLRDGHSVRTTVRSLSRESAVRAMLERGGVDAGTPAGDRTGQPSRSASARTLATYRRDSS